MPKVINLKIDDSLSGKRIETILEKQLRFSRSLISKLKRCKDFVTVDGKSAKLVDKLICGQELRVVIPTKKISSVEAVSLPIDILYEDEDIIAVNKPLSMPSHPSRLHKNDTLANALKFYLGHAGHIITRLDKDTTGVVLVAKNPLAAKILTDAVASGNIEKEYIAVINGTLSPKSGKICERIKRKEEGKIIREVSPDGKEAISLYETLETKDNLSLIKLIPITGRTHQLRVHMSYMGHPIYGDSMYGAPQKGEKLKLHCRGICFAHPVTGKDITIEAPVPETWEKMF